MDTRLFTFCTVAFLSDVLLGSGDNLLQEIQHSEPDGLRLSGHHEPVEDAEQLHAQSLQRETTEVRCPSVHWLF